MFDIYHDVQIDAPIEKVFDAMANPHLMIHWWPLHCSGNMKLGGDYNFFFSPEYDWYGRVIRFDQDQAFHVKMIDADADWNPTTFGYNLLEIDHRSRLEFFHVDWPHRNHHFRRSSYCWAILLRGLKGYLEGGLMVPFTASPQV